MVQRAKAIAMSPAKNIREAHIPRQELSGSPARFRSLRPMTAAANVAAVAVDQR